MSRAHTPVIWRWAAAVLLGAALLSVACANPPRPLSRDKSSLLAALRGAGLTVTSVGKVRQPFLTPVGEAFKINNVARDTIQVFAYRDTASAAHDAAKIRPDGSILGMAIEWIAQPHFYRSDRIIVIYPGTNARLLAALQAALGKPFAVGPKQG